MLKFSARVKQDLEKLLLKKRGDMTTKKKLSKKALTKKTSAVKVAKELKNYAVSLNIEIVEYDQVTVVIAAKSHKDAKKVAVDAVGGINLSGNIEVSNCELYDAEVHKDLLEY